MDGDALAADESSASHSVELVRWPSEAVRRDQLASVGIPRLLLVEAGRKPPAVLLGIEDWIRVPADERDLLFRMARLERQHRSAHPAGPTLDDLVLCNGSRWIALSPLEALIVSPFVEHFGELVTHEEIAAAWDDGVARSLRSRIRGLRVRLAQVGLRLLTVRQRGFVLDFAIEEPNLEEL